MRSEIKVASVSIPLITLLILSLVTNASAAIFTCTSNVCSGSDSFTMGEHGFPTNNVLIRVVDSFKFVEGISMKSIFNTITVFVTATVTQIASTCSGSNCYSNPSATGMESIAEQIIFPLIWIMGTVFGFLYMGLKFFGVSVLISTFILLGLAYIGIIPSYFTLLAIVGVGAALTKMIAGMVGDGGQEA